MDPRSEHEPEPPHDILAAEEFPLGAGDPALHGEFAHDVLAAEEFPLGAGDPALRHGPIVLPEDLTGSPEPHDVLVAEEFPMPAPVTHPMHHGEIAGEGDPAGGAAAPAGGGGRGRLLPRLLIAAAVIALLLGARRHRHPR